MGTVALNGGDEERRDETRRFGRKDMERGCRKHPRAGEREREREELHCKVATEVDEGGRNDDAQEESLRISLTRVR